MHRAPERLCGNASPLNSNKFKPKNPNMKFINQTISFLVNPEAFLSDLRINISKNYLSFDTAKLDNKKPSFPKFVSS